MMATKVLTTLAGRVVAGWIIVVCAVSWRWLDAAETAQLGDTKLSVAAVEDQCFSQCSE